MSLRRTGLAAVLFVAATALVACSHSSPQIVQVFGQVNHVYDPAQGWSDRLSVFVQGANGDGTKAFDRLHLVHSSGLFFTLGRDQWTAVERPGEAWFGANDLAFPDGKVPRGEWRALLVTKAGLQVEAGFTVPPVPLDAPGARKAAVVVTAGAPFQYQVSGWVDDYLVWARDPKGVVLSRNKTTSPHFTVPPGTDSFVLYSYDKARGEGLEAGPFPAQAVLLKPGVPSADR